MPIHKFNGNSIENKMTNIALHPPPIFFPFIIVFALDNMETLSTKVPRQSYVLHTVDAKRLAILSANHLR